VGRKRTVDDRERHPLAIIEAQTAGTAAREQRLQERLVDDDLMRSVVAIQDPRHFGRNAEPGEAIRVRLLDRVVEDVEGCFRIEASADDICTASGYQAQRSTPRIRRCVDSDLPKCATHQVHLASGERESTGRRSAELAATDWHTLCSAIQWSHGLSAECAPGPSHVA
jgi:hypothetical protein